MKNKLNIALLLLAIPLLCYVVSYIYLAFYHESAWLFNKIVHESGKLTLYQDMFYSSHFLAHVPVHIVYALIFTGIYISFSHNNAIAGRKPGIVFFILIVFLLASFIHSILEFGSEGTFNYILQRKQGADIYGEGGSWKLHLPSTISMAFLMPVYVFSFLKIGRQPIVLNQSGIRYMLAGILLLSLIHI